MDPSPALAPAQTEASTPSPTPTPDPRVVTQGRIAFRLAAATLDIIVAYPNGSHRIHLTDTAAANNSPAWFLDGSKIAFRSNRDGNNSDIFVMEADGSNPTNITNDPSFDGFSA